jgi:hypothetical protein
MTVIERSMVVGIFTDRSQADQAVNELHNLGITDDQIGYAVHAAHETPAPVAPDEASPRTVERAIFGAAGGGVAGGIVGAAASLFIPAFSLAVAGSIVLATLGGLVVGAIAGGIVGVLISMAIPQETTSVQQEEVKPEFVIVTVNTPGHEQEVGDALRRFGAYDAATLPVTSAATQNNP